MDPTQLDLASLDPHRTIVVATGNKHKLVEISEILSQVMPDYQFVALSHLGTFDEPEETGETFEENALIKARAARAATGLAAVADDSGLTVDALDGAPGVYSARYAGVHGDDAANNAKLLAALEDVDADHRQAAFVSVVALVFRDGYSVLGRGEVCGDIAGAPRGTHGFGYDPLFLPHATPGRSMAELEPEEKNAMSHRFCALNDLCTKLRQEGY